MTKILSRQQSGLLTATGITFTAGGSSFAANASSEIILAAGTVQTPQLLELSGIHQWLSANISKNDLM